MGVLRRAFVVIVATLGLLLPAELRVEAQGVSTPGLTAAFLFNFVKFTTWPDDALRTSGAIVVCVSGDDRIADALVQLTENKMVEGHPIAVRRTNLDRPLTECHVVYGGSLDGNSAQALIRAAASHPILTVSDLEDFAQRGGMANFFIDAGKMRFSVNPDAADRARLKISSRLLSLARVVRDRGGP
ncbi:MAG: YfiR family protein [Vicinamibacterales bacterium]